MNLKSRIKGKKNNSIKLLCSYNLNFVKKIKSIVRRRWHPKRKCLSIPDTDQTLKKMQRLFEGARTERHIFKASDDKQQTGSI